MCEIRDDFTFLCFFRSCQDVKMKVVSIFVLITFLSISNGYKILFLVPFSGPSHWSFMKHFVIESLSRGHEVTCVTNKPLTGHNATKYTEILIAHPLDLKQAVMPAEDIYESKYSSDFTNVKLLSEAGAACSEHSLNDPSVQKLVHSNGLHFDLVISEQFFNDAWLMFAYKFNAPLVTISTYGASDFFDRAMGMLTPWSHVPHVLLSYTDKMTFTERAYNAYLSIREWHYRNWYALPAQNRLAEQHFGHLVTERNGQPLPTVQQLERDIAVILINTHRSISTPRPMMPGLVNIGGAHIRDPKPLPTDIQQFLDKSTNGAIYFSLGSFMQSKEMSKEKVNMFLQTFAKLKQNVLWKYEDESLPNVPPNVLISKWFPQSDVLAHKNIVLFISHGGMFSTFEGIARGKPILFTPLFGDQHRNALRAENYGYGQKLDFKDVTEESLRSKIVEITTNDAYRKEAARISAVFHDNLKHPMEEAIFWIEYVCRHGGAKHLKSHAINLSWASYLMLDVLGALVLTAFLIVSGIKFIIGKAMSKPKPQPKKKRN